MAFYLQDADDSADTDAAQLDRLGQAQHVLPVLDDKIDVDAGARQPVQRAAVGDFVDAPEPGVANIGEPGTELVAERPEQSEYCIGVGGGVCHGLG